MLLVAELDIYEEYDAAVDTDPPVITINGAEYVELLQMDTYSDAGASAYDVFSTRYVAVTTEGLDEVQQCLAEGCITDSEAPLRVQYTASDSSGNTANAATRHVAVLAFCASPSYLCADSSPSAGRTCATCQDVDHEAGDGTVTSACSCEEFSVDFASAEVVSVESYEPTVDVTPPVLALLGDGQMAVTDSGIVLMIHTVNKGSEWVDPGVTATDDMDGDLTAGVQSFGVGAVDTTMPSEEPYVVTYSVDDAAGNSAACMRRRVYVVDPCGGAGVDGGDEQVCEELADGGVTCSVSGLCENMDFTSESGDEEEATQTPLTLTLRGDSDVEIPLGTTYTACPAEGPRAGEVCDPGASATDDLDGDLTGRVLACSPDGQSNRFAVRGVGGCAVQGDVPGVYNITFSVANSAGTVASATRSVSVTASCGQDYEKLCSDHVTCSSEGTCLDDLDGLADPTAAPGSPTVTLRSSLAMPTAYVEVRQHGEYRACESTEAQHAEVLCDPGVDAADEEDGNLTAQVVVCPPSECEGLVACAGHEWVSKGVRGCVNTSAAVGTVFDVVFQVYDSSQPANGGSVTRHVSIIAPCASGEELCEDLSCSNVSCAARDAWTSAEEEDATPPTITLLQSSPARVVYGDAAASSALQPCTSADGRYTQTPCAASARDNVDGDISSSLVTPQRTSCEGCSTTACPRDEVHLCFPGTYGYSYEATDAAGNRGAALLLVRVVEEAAVSAQTVLAAGSDSREEAEAQAAVLLDEASSEAAAFRQGIANLLNSGDFRGRQERSLVVSYTMAVASGERASKGRRRGLLDLATYTDDVAALLMASAGDGRMSQALDLAALEQGASLPTAVTGLASDVTSSQTSIEVDEEAAYRSNIAGEIDGLQLASARLAADLDEGVLPAMERAGGDADDWTERQLGNWVNRQQTEFESQEFLLADMQRLKLRHAIYVQAQELVQEGLLDAELTLQANLQKMQQALEAHEEAIAAALALQARQSADGYSSCGLASLHAQGGVRSNLELQYAFAVGGPEANVTSSTTSANELRRRLSQLDNEDYARYAEHRWWRMPTLADVDELTRTSPFTTPPRYLLASKHVLVGGILSYVKRHAEDVAQPCTKRFNQLHAPCFNQPLGEGYYGRDPVFSPSSSLFRPELQDKVGLFYNTSEDAEMIDETHRTPRPFWPRPLPGHHAGYPAYIDTRVDEFRAQE
ncbi:hypothetical protein CYMTET_30357, partial [Cymbomonas tetramitiformis]